MYDTIAVISTALGVGAISIIRISGTKSINIVNSIFSNDLCNKDTNTINYGYITYKNEIIDEVLVSVMKAPKTFTKEDIVEINCHGGIATTNKILEILLNSGCRLANPGEFSERAYVNGRINLEEAEGIMNLINSKTEKARKLSINQLKGKTTELITDLKSDIASILANIQVNIDFPEYEDIETVTIEQIKNKMKKFKIKLNKIIDESKNGKIIQEGITTAIIGKPNVGKSSLLNFLLDEDKAIVTNIEGTTRDVVEGKISIDGILLNIVDTAGIRDTKNLVEQLGVKKSRSFIEKADLIVLVLNNNEEINQNELEIIKQIKNKNYIILINKVDLPRKININQLEDLNYIEFSVTNNIGEKALKTKIKEIFNLSKLDTADLTYLTSARSLSLLNSIIDIIKDIDESIVNNIPVDLIEIDLRNIWKKLGEILGINVDNEIVTKIFSNFCLGK